MIIELLYPLLERLSRSQTRWTIIGLHIGLLALLFADQGILADKEALKYIGCAQDVLQGDLGDLTGNYVKYGAYVVFLLPFVAIGDPSFAVAAQVLIGIIAAGSVERYAARLTGNVGLGRLAMALFLLCPIIQTWCLALYTEHFFTCMSVIFIEHMDRARPVSASLIGSGLLAFFGRPVGFLFVVPTLLWRWGASWQGPVRSSVIAIGCAVMIIIAVCLPHIGPAQLAPIASGQVIAGIGGTGADGFQGRTIADAHGYLIGQVGIVEWVRITLRKAVSLLTLTRPYYSAIHNGTNAVFYLLYPLALIGLWRSRHDPRIQLVSIVLGANILIVALTHDEWSGRFMVPLVPWIMLLACASLGKKHHQPLPG